MSVTKVRSSQAEKKADRLAKKRSNPALENMAIPLEPNEPPKNLSQYVLMILGEKGIGKTTLASMFKNSLTFMWEPRRRNLKIRQIPDPTKDEPRLSWERYRHYIKMIAESPSSTRPSSVVTDTIDRAYNSCFNWVCKKNGVNHPSEANDWGKTWDGITEEFNLVMDMLLFAGIGVVYTSHAKLHTIETATGEVSQWGPTCKDKCWEYCKAVVDCAFFYGYTGRQRTLTLRGDSHIWAACGTPDNFLTPEGQQIRTLALPDSPKDAFSTLLKAYKNECVEYVRPVKKKKVVTK